MKPAFRVLLIDDDEAVLRALQSHLERTISVDDTSRRIEVAILRVAYDQPMGKWTVGADTVHDLAKLCVRPFDYIFADFAYVADSSANSALRDRLLKEQRGVTDADLMDFVLTIKDLKARYEELRPAFGYEVQRAIEENFIRHKGHVQIYTLSPRPFDNYFNDQAMPARRAEIASVFTEATKFDPFILMHEDYCITPEIDAAFKDSQDQQRFVTALLSRRLDTLMHIVALEDIVRAQGRLRFDVTSKAFARLANEALAFGAVVALFGEAVYHFFVHAVELGYDDYKGWPKTLLAASFSKSAILNLVFALACAFLALFVFRRWGIRLAKALEKMPKQLVAVNGTET
jgi:hypothetical protein